MKLLKLIRKLFHVHDDKLHTPLILTTIGAKWLTKCSCGREMEALFYDHQCIGMRVPGGKWK